MQRFLSILISSGFLMFNVPSGRHQKETHTEDFPPTYERSRFWTSFLAPFIIILLLNLHNISQGRVEEGYTCLFPGFIDVQKHEVLAQLFLNHGIREVQIQSLVITVNYISILLYLHYYLESLVSLGEM